MFKLMIVDDEQVVLNTLSLTYPWEKLEITTVITATSGMKGLENFRNEPADIVITDIRMPGMNGLEMINEIKKISKKTKFILLSGHSEFAYAQQAIQDQVLEYLLKPVKEAELLSSVERALLSIKQEWEEVASYQRAQYAMRENLPLLRQTLLSDLLQGRRYSDSSLNQRMESLNLQLRCGSGFMMMTLRLEKGFERFDASDLDLIEYAIANMTEEVFSDGFHLWKCKDVHDYLTFVIFPKHTSDAVNITAQPGMQSLPEHLALQLQSSVKQFLNGNISVMLTKWGIFPQDMILFYQYSISKLRLHLVNEEGYFISPSKPKKVETMTPLYILYEPPTILHLLEAGRWDEVSRKLDIIFNDLEQTPSLNREHILEAALLIAYTSAYISHKNGHYIADIYNYDLYTGLEHINSVERLKVWSTNILSAIRKKTEESFKHDQSSIMHQIHSYIEQHIYTDVSLQSIADYIHMHPAYLSKIYKDENEECISDYIYRLRMEKAAYMLTTSDDTVNEIAKKIGYVNPSYFIKIFRKFFNVTPNEYRKGNNI